MEVYQNFIMRFLVTSLLLAAAISFSSAKVFSRCELAQELLKYGFSKADLPSWVCIIESQSGRDTRAINVNSNGSKDYGLFQINSQYWCSDGPSPGKECNVKCADLLSENITQGVECAKKIFQRRGYSAWASWNRNCKGKVLPDLSGCQLN